MLVVLLSVAGVGFGTVSTGKLTADGKVSKRAVYLKQLAPDANKANARSFFHEISGA
jgi:hypothetical protein